MPDLAPLSTVVKLGIRLGYPEGVFPTDAETDRAEAALVDASDLIRDIGDPDWTAATVPPRVEKICLASAKRAFENAEGLTQRSIGDSARSYDRSRREGGEVVYLTDGEQRVVRRAAAASSFVAVTLVSPYSGDDTESVLGS
ncbi:MAG TPA: hypothetical protein VFC00_30010 [Micromonosporaceae bacterium]|nr:hypothetical protein [Micromonosporaceae bacterium]